MIFKFRKVRNILIFFLVLVHIVGVVFYYNLVVRSDYDPHRIDNKLHESEIDFQLNDDLPTTEFLLTSTEWPRKEEKRIYFDGIYVREAYRVSNEEIRLVYLAYHNNRQQLHAKINDKWESFDWFCANYTTCIDYDYCSMAPRIGRLFIDPIFEHQETISVSSQLSNEYYDIKLNDVRLSENHKYPHILGVCLQPIFFLNDWTIIIQFLESWINQGATKLYIYRHSYSKNVERVFKFYANELGDNLEFIDWSDLPVARRDRGNYDRDPNSHVFRHGATAFMHDCMLRARSKVKFIANTDLDDLPISRNLNFPSDLESLSNRHKSAGQFIMDWWLSEQKQNWDKINTPLDISFDLDKVKVIEMRNVRFDYAIAKKIIHRPERVMHFDQHRVLGNEKMKNGKHYTAVEMFGNGDMFFVHLRRFTRNLKEFTPPKYNTTFDYQLLRKLNRKMITAFKNRIKKSEFSGLQMSPWSMEAREIIRNLEQCRLEGFGKMLNSENEMCQQSSAGCEGMLMTDMEFIKFPITWINIAHKALFNNYTKNTDE